MSVRGSLRWLAHQTAQLPPGYFAMVMAIGILSTATLELGMDGISIALLVLAGASYLVLSFLTMWRLLAYLDCIAIDIANPNRAFAFFTFVAASNVLSLRMHASGHTKISVALAVVAMASWILLTYLLPVKLILVRPKTYSITEVSAAWLLWVVGTQSVASAMAVFGISQSGQYDTFSLVAVALWGFGVLLYLLLITMILARLFLAEVSIEQLTAPYWITMGATAITTFAAAHILSIPGQLPVSRSFVESLGFVVWAFGTWWFPFLILLGVWRHGIQRAPLTYDIDLWGMVFPLGMYAAASYAFGQVAGLLPLELAARWEIWLGLVAWAGVLLIMVHSWVARAVTAIRDGKAA